MSRIKLRNGDIALLGRLNLGPLELGDISADSVGRLEALGLARKVLGSCKITRAGQLTFHRQSFTRVSRRKIARVSRRHPLFLQEERLRGPLNRVRLLEYLKIRRSLDSNLRHVTLFPRWLRRLASETAGRFRPRHEAPAGPGVKGRARAKHEPHKGLN